MCNSPGAIKLQVPGAHHEAHAGNQMHLDLLVEADRIEVMHVWANECSTHLALMTSRPSSPKQREDWAKSPVFISCNESIVVSAN